MNINKNMNNLILFKNVYKFLIDRFYLKIKKILSKQITINNIYTSVKNKAKYIEFK